MNSLLEGQPGGSHVVDVKAVANKGDQIVYSIISDSQGMSASSINNISVEHCNIYVTQTNKRDILSARFILR